MLASTAASVLRSALTRAASSSSAESAALAAFRASNASLPSLAGSTVLARVLRAERAFVVVDAGLKRPVRLARGELRPEQLVSSSSSAAAVRAGPGDVRVGDVLRVHVDAVTTPYGDPALSSGPLVRPAAARDAAWAAIEAASSSGDTVLGRVLNGIGAGGFAVGVGGLIGFLPHSMTAPSTVARVGTLQPFRVIQIDADARTFVLEDMGAAARRATAAATAAAAAKVNRARQLAAAAAAAAEREAGGGYAPPGGGAAAWGKPRGARPAWGAAKKSF